MKHLPRPLTFLLVVAAAFALGACLASRTPTVYRAPTDTPVLAPDSAPPHEGPPPAEEPPEKAPDLGLPPLPPPPPGASGAPAAEVPSAAPAASGSPGSAAPAPAAARRTAPPLIRVRLSEASRAGRADVAVDGAWTVRSLDGATLASGKKLHGTLVLSPSGATLGDLRLPRDGATLVPQTSGDLRVGSRRYPGVLRIARSAEGRVHADVDLPVETYLEGVVAGELPPDFPREARRVQAIIARTYLLSQPTISWTADVIPVDDSGRIDQEYVGIAGSATQQAAVRDAVESTRGVVLFDGTQPLRAWYHSTCGGHTCPAAPVFKVPATAPLAGVPCEFCSSSKYWRWHGRIDGAKVVKAAGLRGTLQSFRSSETTPEGRALWFEVRAGNRTARVHAAEFRLAVGPSDLRSTWLDGTDIVDGALVVAGRGWGHGVGLCQVGAKGLALQGVSAESIVRRYYPGATLRREW